MKDENGYECASAVLYRMVNFIYYLTTIYLVYTWLFGFHQHMLPKKIIIIIVIMVIKYVTEGLISLANDYVM